MIENFIAKLKQFIPPIVWNILKKLPVNLRKYYGAENLDEKIEKYLNFDDGFYVELGANDGLNQSNTYYFEKFRNWQGVLIEPSPHIFLKLIANRSSKNAIFCNACVSFGFDQRFVEIIYSNLMSSPLNLESDIDDPVSHANLGTKFLEYTEKLYTFGAPAKTLNSILLESNAPKLIDFLSLDVEGAEIEVLKGVDHDVFRFRFICVEVRDFKKMETYLNEKGYELVEQLSVHDFLFRDKDLT